MSSNNFILGAVVTVGIAVVAVDVWERRRAPVNLSPGDGFTSDKQRQQRSRSEHRNDPSKTSDLARKRVTERLRAILDQGATGRPSVPNAGLSESQMEDLRTFLDKEGLVGVECIANLYSSDMVSGGKAFPDDLCQAISKTIISKYAEGALGTIQDVIDAVDDRDSGVRSIGSPHPLLDHGVSELAMDPDHGGKAYEEIVSQNSLKRSHGIYLGMLQAAAIEKYGPEWMIETLPMQPMIGLQPRKNFVEGIMWVWVHNDLNDCLRYAHGQDKQTLADSYLSIIFDCLRDQDRADEADSLSKRVSSSGSSYPLRSAVP